MDFIRASQEILRKNRRTTDGHQYTVPSPDTYPYQWLWDSCFHAIILSHLEPDAARAELRALLSKQLPSGMVPHIIYWQPGELHHYEWGTQGTSALTQPPMLAYAAFEVYKQAADYAFLREVYPALMRYYHYLMSERDPRQHHLVGLINPDESGEDTSPRFDHLLGVPDDINLHDHLARRLKLVEQNRTCNFDASLCMSEHFWVKDVPFNAILVKNLQVLGEAAALVGSEEDKHWCALQAQLVRDAMRDRLLKNGVFYSASAVGGNYELIEVDTWAHFAPLFAGLYTKAEAEALARRMRDPAEFWGAWGLRTVSAKEASYRPAPEGPADVRDGGFWRGPVWMAPHWFVYKGLAAYGLLPEADAVRNAAIRLIETSGFREYYHPDTGDGLGATDFTWGALILDMMHI